MKTYVTKIAPVSQTNVPACINGINICSIHFKLPSKLVSNWLEFVPKTLSEIYRNRVRRFLTLSAVVPGFEPGQTEPKPVVLPLHHTTIAYALKGLAKILKAGYSAMSR